MIDGGSNMRFFKFGKKFFFALFFVPLICIIILSSDNTNRLAFAKDSKLKMHTTTLPPANVNVTQITIGNPTARVKIILYLSPSCHNCAEILINHFDYFKKIVDESSGSICLEIKPYVGSKGDLDAVKLMYLASKSESGLDRAEVLLTIFRKQNDWINSSQIFKKPPRTFLLNDIIGRPELKKKLQDNKLQSDILRKCKSEYKDYINRLSGTGIPIIKVCVREMNNRIRTYEYSGNSGDEKNLKAFINAHTSAYIRN